MKRTDSLGFLGEFATPIASAVKAARTKSYASCLLKGARESHFPAQLSF